MINLTVRHRDGGTTKTTVWAATEVAFEQRFAPLSWGEAWREEIPHETYLYFMAWHSIHDDDRTALTFEAWLRTVATVEVDIEETRTGNEAPPTDPGAVPG